MFRDQVLEDLDITFSVLVSFTSLSAEDVQVWARSSLKGGVPGSCDILHMRAGFMSPL